MALKNSRNKVDYINSHGTSTPVGDTKELEAIAETFKKDILFKNNYIQFCSDWF